MKHFMNKELKNLIQDDLRRYGFQSEKNMSFMTKQECYGYNFTKCLRKCNWYKEHHKWFLFMMSRMKLRRMSERYGFQISYATKIGRGLYLGHMGSIIVNWEAVIGNNVNLSQGVTIGRANGGKKDGVPIIGDNVWIGANATIVGNVTIGNDVMIAPNTFVNFDVPAHSLVIMEKARIICQSNATENYVENTVKVN